MILKQADRSAIAPRDKYQWGNIFKEFLDSGYEVAELDLSELKGGINNMIYEGRRMIYYNLYPIKIIKRQDHIFLQNTSIRKDD